MQLPSRSESRHPVVPVMEPNPCDFKRIAPTGLLRFTPKFSVNSFSPSVHAEMESVVLVLAASESDPVARWWSTPDAPHVPPVAPKSAVS